MTHEGDRHRLAATARERRLPEDMDDLKRQVKAGAEYAEMHITLTEKYRQCESERDDAVTSLAKRSEQLAACRKDLDTTLEQLGSALEEWDRLGEACEKVEVWLRRLSERATQQADATEWPSMIDAYRADAKNYGAVAKDLRAALEPKP